MTLPAYGKKGNTIAAVGAFGSLSVDGAAAIGGAATIAGDASVTGNTTVTGNVSAALVIGSAATVTAHAGGTKAAALAMTAQFNMISVCATADDSVLLPAALAGRTIYVFNAGAAAARVFGAGTDTIDGVATATGVPMTNDKRAVFVCFADGAWASAQLGVVSA